MSLAGQTCSTSSSWRATPSPETRCLPQVVQASPSLQQQPVHPGSTVPPAATASTGIQHRGQRPAELVDVAPRPATTGSSARRRRVAPRPGCSPHAGGGGGALGHPRRSGGGGGPAAGVTGPGGRGLGHGSGPVMRAHAGPPTPVPGPIPPPSPSLLSTPSRASPPPRHQRAPLVTARRSLAAVPAPRQVHPGTPLADHSDAGAVTASARAAQPGGEPAERASPSTPPAAPACRRRRRPTVSPGSPVETSGLPGRSQTCSRPRPAGSRPDVHRQP